MSSYKVKKYPIKRIITCRKCNTIFENTVTDKYYTHCPNCGLKQNGTFKGRTHSEESKNKNRQAHLGKIPWNRGKKTGPISEETKRKMSIINKHPNSGQFVKGQKQFRSDEHNRKIGLAHLGKPKIFNRGIGNVNWRNGITQLCEKIRKYDKYKTWRDSVYIRDRFTCLNCSKIGGDLHAHHFTPFSDMLANFNITTLEQAMDCKELWDVDNGITLCISCHRTTF